MSDAKMTVERAVELVKKHGGVTAAARAAGVSKSTVRKWYDRRDSASVAPAKAPVAASAGRSVSEFQSIYDKDFIVPNRIKDGLAKLGAKGWEYELQFSKLAGVGLADLSVYREQFSEFIVPVEKTKRVWAGSKAFAAELREMV